MTPTWLKRLLNCVVVMRVETRGKYTAVRVRELTGYLQHLTSLRRFLILLLFPLPSLLVTLALELIPLAPPYDGAVANWALYIRSFGLVFALSFLVLYQFAHFLPSLPFTKRQHVLYSMVVAIVNIPTHFWFAYKVAFPLPFALVLAAPFLMISVVAAMAIAWRNEIKRQMPGLKKQLVHANNVWSCAASLLIIYPAYYYVYSLLPSFGRKAFSMLLLLIKVLLRAWFNFSVAHLRDEVPIAILFDVDVFNALFITYCMQSTPSPLTTGGLMLADLVQSTLSLLDLKKITGEVRQYYQQGVSLSIDEIVSKSTSKIEESLLISVSTMMSTMGSELVDDTSAKSTSKTTSRTSVKAVTPFHTKDYFIKNTTSIAPSMNGETQQPPDKTLSSIVQPGILSAHNRRKCVDGARRALYAVEFLLLINYIEAIVPIIYATYLGTIYYLPNHDYFVSTASMSTESLHSTVRSLYFYGAMEFVSLLSIHFALKKGLGLPGLELLAFVFEKHWAFAQMKLVFWVLFNAQPALLHYGYDYTFKFAWLHK